MATVRIEMNAQGAKEILKSAEVQADLHRRAEAIAAAAGGKDAGFEVEENLTGERARAVVITRTEEAMRAEAQHRTLTRALEAGRG